MNVASFSIIVPTFNRPASLLSCLASLIDMDYPAERFEIVIVDDGGSTAVLPPQTTAGVRIRMLRQSNAGPAAARNFGALHADGEILAFTDDDCRPRPGWLRAFAQAHQRMPGYGVGGNTRDGIENNACSAASQSVQEVMHHHFNVESGRCIFFPSNNVSFPRKEFLAIGGFNPEFRTAEDRNFCDRWIHSGKQLAYAPDAVVEHHHRLHFLSLFSQHFAYGRGAFHFYGTRKRCGGRGLSVDLHFYRKLLMHPFRRGSRKRMSLLGSILVTQVANVAGYAWQGIATQRDPINRKLYGQSNARRAEGDPSRRSAGNLS